MRYITQHSNLVLYRDNGDYAYRFGPQGVLVVGSASTDTGSGNAIDADLNATYPAQQLQRVYDTDLGGNLTNCLEMCGMGSLVSVDAEGNDLSSLEAGYNRIFFEAPVITPGATTIPAIAGIYYEVLSGTVTYDSVDYTVGQTIVSDGTTTTTSTSDSGTFALMIPPAMVDEVDEFLDEHYKIKNLKTGNEASDYFNWDNGFTPRNSAVSTDTDYFGYTE